MTKKILMLMMAMIACALAMAGTDDLLLAYSTKGVDRYEDGMVVPDGECYALVYTRAGYSFAGFNADGTALDPEGSDIALVAPVAEGGRCPPTLFQVNGNYASLRKNGAWEVFLLDTRDADGNPTGLDAEGRLVRINRWRRVKGRIRAKRGAVTSNGTFESLDQSAPADALAGGAGALPPNAPKPRITGIRVQDGKVVLTVADTVPFLSYDIDGAHEPHGFAHGRRRSRLARKAKDGNATRTITLEVDPDKDDGTTRFFKVVRKD